MKKLIIILTCLISVQLSAQGVLDGYFKGKGNLDLAMSGFFQSSQDFFAGTNKVVIPRSIASLGVFGQYGITPMWDAVVNIPIINNQLQDISIATKYELIKTKVGGKDLSIIPAIIFATPISNYSTNTSQAIGQQATVISPKLIVQQNLTSSLFLQVQSGYNYALSPVISSVPFSAKLGGSFGKLYIDLWFDNQNGLGDIDYPVSGELFRELTVSYNRIGGVFYYGLKGNLGTFVNYSYTINGRNTSKAFGIGTGIVLKFSTKKKE